MMKYGNTPAHSVLRSALFLSAMLISCNVFAAEQPDAGQTVREMQRNTPQLLDKNSPVMVAPTSNEKTYETSGPEVQIDNVGFEGNAIFSDEELQSVVADVPGGSYTLGGLKNIAGRVTAFYRENGYPFAKAILPPQNLAEGHLKVQVVEGAYGNIEVTGEEDSSLIAQARNFLNPLKSGEVIEADALERSVLILNDQPGYSVTPVIRPGEAVGSGDLAVTLHSDKRYGGALYLDNYGNRYTGRGRVRAALYANSPFMFGDQVVLNGVYTEENLAFGSAQYSLPLGNTGLRGNIGYAHTNYELGKQFSSLDARGTAKIASAGVSYPLVRSQDLNLNLSATYQHKWLTDTQGASSTKDKKSSDVIPVTLGFDVRDGLLGGGVTYGSLSWTHGVLDLDNGLALTDQITARSEGAFDKFNAGISRIQALPFDGFSLFGQVSGQLAMDNLDSSESFGLGGPNGVRAYPTGESYGDEGALGQIELRYAIDSFQPYVFYDYGHIKTNDNPWTTADNDRSLGGGGVGLRFNKNNWNANAFAAWRNVGGSPQSDDKDQIPQLWVSIGYEF